MHFANLSEQTSGCNGGLMDYVFFASEAKAIAYESLYQLYTGGVFSSSLCGPWTME